MLVGDGRVSFRDMTPAVYGPRGARMNDMLAVLKLLGERRIRTRIAARFPLEASPDLVGRIVVLPWAQPRSGDCFNLCPASCGVVAGIARSGSVRGSG